MHYTIMKDYSNLLIQGKRDVFLQRLHITLEFLYNTNVCKTLCFTLTSTAVPSRVVGVLTLRTHDVVRTATALLLAGFTVGNVYVPARYTRHVKYMAASTYVSALCI